MNKPSTRKTPQKKTVLIADDDPSIVDSIEIMLEDAGYAVETSVNGETLLIARKKYPDVILLDIWMSGMDGRDICRQLKMDEKTKHVPVIMISANRDTEQIARDAGADDFITKPFERGDLLAMLEKYMPADGKDLDTEMIQTLHPTPGKTNKRIYKKNYLQMKDAILSILRAQRLTHTELFTELHKKLHGAFDGNISWYGETVKLDLEARKLIGRTSDKPHKYFISLS